MNQSINKSAQKTAEIIDLDQTYPQQQIQISHLLNDNEGQAAFSDVDEEIMVISGRPLDLQDDNDGGDNNNLSEPQNYNTSNQHQPLQSIENVQDHQAITNNKNTQFYYFNYQQNLPQKNTGASGASEQKIVDTLVIGGGPASLGLLVNAVKTNRLTELLQGDGLAIIDAGLNFGGGILGRYGINSNTSGGGFLKCTYKKIKKEKNNNEAKTTNNEDEANNKKGLKKGDLKLAGVVGNNANGKTLKVQKHSGSGNASNDTGFSNPYSQQFAQSSKNMMGSSLTGEQSSAAPSNDILAPYKELYNSNISRVLKDFGKNTAPLAVIGHFLNYSGNHLLSFIHQTTKKKVFYPLHKAVSIQLMSNGEILTKVKRQQLEISVTDDSESLKIIETDQIVVFRSRMLIISNGGVQGLHPELFNWYPSLDPSKVVSSDEFLRSACYLQNMNLLRQKKNRKIVIIGGSHSGFSCAWMLLNGPATYYNNNAGIQIPKEPYAQRKSVKNCVDCCQCGAVLNNLKKQKAQLNQQNAQQNVTSPNKQPDKQKDSTSANIPQTCNCLCICFGLFDYDDWKFDYSQLPDYQEGDIEILFREQIKVFYNKVSDAEKDGYNQFEQDKFSKKDGYLYSFSGLRGDAKDLYLKIMRGQEKRVRLVQAKSAEEQRKYVEQGDLVIWACGYQTNQIPIKDTDRKRLQLSQRVPNTQYDVDGKCRVMLADGHVLAKIFACGIAYPVRTKDGMMVSNPQVNNPRADGFSLYMNFVGDNILKSIIPKSKMIKSTVHKIMPKNQMIQVEVAQSAAQNTAQNEQLSKKQYQQVLRNRIQQYRQKNNDGNDTLGVPEGVLEKQRAIRNKSVNAPPGIRSSSAAPGQTDDEFSGVNIEQQQKIILHINDEGEDNEGDEDDYQQQHFELEDNDEEGITTTSLAQQQDNNKMSLRIQQINAIQRQQNNKAQGGGGTKSVDRGQVFKSTALHQVTAVNGGSGNSGSMFQNKFSQMARSPQILQRKQENIIKMQAKQGLGDLNQDIALLMTPEGPCAAVDNQQVLAVSRQIKSRKMRGDAGQQQQQQLNARMGPQIQSKSPYNQHVKGGQFMKSQIEGGGSAQLNKNQGVGREILKSSQGANRKLDMILAMHKDSQQQIMGAVNSGGSFKVSNNNRQSQASFNGKQRNKQSSIHQNNEGAVFAQNMYNSLGSGQQQTIQEINQRSSRQGTYDQRRHGGVEFPPILHPLAQNHYMHLQSEHFNDLSSINLNQTGIAAQDMNNSNDNSNINLNLFQNNDHSHINKTSQSRLFKQPIGNILNSDMNLGGAATEKQQQRQVFKGGVNAHQVSSFENNKSMRSSSIYCLQGNDHPNSEKQHDHSNSTLTMNSKARNLPGSQVKTLIPTNTSNSLLLPPTLRERPLSDQRQDENATAPIRVIDGKNVEKLIVKNKLHSPKKTINKGHKAQVEVDVVKLNQNYEEDEDCHGDDDVNIRATEDNDDEYGVNKMIINMAAAKQHKNIKKFKKITQSPPPQRQQRILSGETNESPLGGYENEKFELDNNNNHANGVLYKNLDSQEAEDEYGIDEDVSSEGSCRTSLYQVSLKGDDDYEQSNNNTGSGVSNNNNQIATGKAKPSNGMINDGSQKTTNSEFTKSQASGDVASSSKSGNGGGIASKKDNFSSKFSFQSRIPRLSKPNQNHNVVIIAASKPQENQQLQQVSQGLDDYQVAKLTKKVKVSNGVGGSHSPVNGDVSHNINNLGVSKKQTQPFSNEHSANKPQKRLGLSHNDRKLLGNKNTQGQVNVGLHQVVESNQQQQQVVVTNQELIASVGATSAAGFNRQQDLKSSQSNQSSQQLHRRNTLNPQNSNKQANAAAAANNGTSTSGSMHMPLPSSHGMLPQSHSNTGGLMTQDKAGGAKLIGKATMMAKEASKKTNETKAAAVNSKL